MSDRAPLRVGILAYPGCFASEVFGVLDLLTMATHVAAAQQLPPSVVTTVVSPRRRVLASGGVSIGVEPVRPVDVLVVPGFALVPGDDVDRRLQDLGQEVELVRTQSASGTAVVSICVGAFVLAAAGVLDGRRATTAWLFADTLARACPGVRLTEDQLVVTDAGVTTTAAFSAMYDFVLDLVERQYGRRVSRRTARIALLDDARTTQTPYVDQHLLPATGTSFSNEVQRYLDQHLEDRYDLAALAAHFRTSTRTLLRRYKADTGEPPLAYLQRARVRRARHLLENTDRGVGEIRTSVGYRDAGAFNELFRRHIGVVPSAFRARFRTG
jgi:transcriptional regulator GlxA family with amidase domain